MGKRKQTFLSELPPSEREEQAAKFKWELLRRRKDYIEEAIEINKVKDRAKDQETFLIYIQESEKFYKKWGISGCPPLEKNFKDMSVVEKWGLFKCSLNIDHRLVAFLAGHKHRPLYSPDNLKNLSPLKVEIDLDMPKEKIMHELGSLIETSQRIKEEMGYRDNPRTKNYEDLLKVYDLRETKVKGKPMPFSQVIRKMYPKRQKDDFTKTLEDTVRKSYLRAKDLVDNAHKDVW